MKDFLQLMLVETYSNDRREEAFEDFWQNSYCYDYVAFESDTQSLDPNKWKFYIKYYNKITRPSTEEEKNIAKNSWWHWAQFYQNKPIEV